MGMSGAAFSLAGAHPDNWATAGLVAVAVFKWLETAPRRTLLNVNIPDRPLSDIRGARWGRIAAFGPEGLTVTAPRDGEVRVTPTRTSLPLDPETDAGLVSDGFVSVTPLVGIQAIPGDGAANRIEEELLASQPSKG
jgi:5'-nucleotidase